MKLYVQRIRVQVISSKGEYGKGVGVFVTKRESIFFPDFLAFPIYTKYLDHCVAKQVDYKLGERGNLHSVKEMVTVPLGHFFCIVTCVEMYRIKVKKRIPWLG